VYRLDVRSDDPSLIAFKVHCMLYRARSKWKKELWSFDPGLGSDLAFGISAAEIQQSLDDLIGFSR
jgi:hypothetical protein